MKKFGKKLIKEDPYYNVYIDDEWMGVWTFKQIKEEMKEFIKWESKDTPEIDTKKEYTKAIKELKEMQTSNVCGCKVELFKIIWGVKNEKL